MVKTFLENIAEQYGFGSVKRKKSKKRGSK